MIRRICMIAVANDFLNTLLPRLSKSVCVAAQQECFDRPVSILRLEGDGLPEWCEEQPHGIPYVWASAIIGTDGVVRFAPVSPASPATPSLYEKILESFGRKN